MTSEQGNQSRLKWTLTQAAEQCSVSRSTIRRYRESGKFPNAEKIGGQWRIPVTDLIAAGLRPGKPAPPEELPTEQAHPGQSKSTEHDKELEDLRTQLRIEQAQRKAAEQIAAERESALEDMRRAMRMLEGNSNRNVSEQSVGTEIENSVPVHRSNQQKEEPKPKKNKTWWRRLFS